MKLITLKEASEMLSVSPRTIMRMIADGELASPKIRGCRRVKLSDIEKLVNSQA